jgi:hypothetical protein
MRRVDAGISALIKQRFLLPTDSVAARTRMSDVWERYGVIAK